MGIERRRQSQHRLLRLTLAAPLSGLVHVPMVFDVVVQIHNEAPVIADLPNDPDRLMSLDDRRRVAASTSGGLRRLWTWRAATIEVHFCALTRDPGRAANGRESA
jgi:hypothetical protein